MAEGIPDADFVVAWRPLWDWRLPGSFVEMEDAVELLVSSCYYGFEEVSNYFRWSASAWWYGGGPARPDEPAASVKAD